jgi:hypothetical protein
MSDRKFEWLEVLRGFAALWVLLHHGLQSVNHFLQPHGHSPLVANGYLGVDFFFVLSGFIIAFSALRLSERGGGLPEYLQARLVRIYVPYLPVGVGMVVLYLMLPGLSEGGRTPSLLTSLTLLPTNSPPALSVAWTLVHEMVFYAVFSLWFLSRRLLWILMATWIASILFILANDVELTRFQRYFFSPLNLYFALGVGLMHLMQRITIGGGSALLLSVVGVFLVGYEAMDQKPDRLVVGIGFAFLVLAAASAAASSLNIWSWALKLGAASYAIYLVHNPVLSMAMRILKRVAPGTSPWLGLLIIGSIALASGLLYWWLYERHALRWVRSRLAKR